MNVTVKIKYDNKTITFDKSLCCADFAASATSDDSGFKLIISPVKPLSITKLTASFDYRFEKTDRLFLNSYQSWTDSAEHEISDKMRGLNGLPKKLIEAYRFDSYGDYNFTDYTNKRGLLHGFGYAYIRRDNEYFLLGSLSERSGFTVIYFDTARNVITLEKELEGFTADGDFTAFDIAFERGDEAAVFDGYFSRMKIKKPLGKTLRGYTSWYNHYQNINEKVISDDLSALSDADIFQIDDGYQTAVGDWLSVDGDKFPNGMSVICDKIHEKKLLSGIWLAPFVCEEKSELFKKHSDWILRDNDGKLVKAGNNWSGFYALDTCNENVKSYIKSVFDVVLNEWHYDLVKLDFLYAACIIPYHGKTRGEIMCNAMDFLRECVGDKLILGCGVPLSAAFGTVDYCRIGCDVSLSWNDKAYMRLMHRERISTKNCILNTIYRRQLNGRAFLNDPDVFLLRSDNISLTDEQKRILATVNCLFGSVLFTSDNESEYSSEQKKLFSDSLSLSGSSIKAITRDRNIISISYGESGMLRFDVRKGKIVK